MPLRPHRTRGRAFPLLRPLPRDLADALEAYRAERERFTARSLETPTGAGRDAELGRVIDMAAAVARAVDDFRRQRVSLAAVVSVVSRARAELARPTGGAS